MPDPAPKPPGVHHGARDLPSVTVDAYNAELRDEEGFIGDRASNRAFRAILDDWREKLTRLGGPDPIGSDPSKDISKKKLDKLLTEGDLEAAGIVHGAVEDFARELATVLRKFLKLKDWKGTERVVIGGGLREARIGEIAVGRASVLLKADGVDLTLVPIRNHPDEAGLIGAVHLVPAWVFSGHDAILAVDIGGTNIRAGLVETRAADAPDMSKARVRRVELWRHRDDKPSRTAAVDRLGEMLAGLVARAERAGLRLAPFVGIGCPGLIAEDGSITRGGQNLPGNWESERFNLPAEIVKRLPRIADHDTTVIMHNDAVVQGLSEVPFMQDVRHWAVATIGTGLGNARFSNKAKD
jgi:predicted NBD/HSP70 family sugar kinase